MLKRREPKTYRRCSLDGRMDCRIKSGNDAEDFFASSS